jgi:branched-chain amino acid transport system substrate-binding protein
MDAFIKNKINIRISAASTIRTLCYAFLLNLINSIAAAKEPVLIGIDAEFGLQSSTSAQAIELGARAAVEEINAAGGVLGGRPLQLVIRDNRSIPARGVQNLLELAAMPDLVAVLGGRFSPVILEQLPLIQSLHVPYLVVWASADQIINNDMHPNYVFRLSLSDSLAMPYMLEHAAARGFNKVGLLLSNTAWGRSNLAAAEKYVRSGRPPKIVRSSWYSWADTSLIDKYNNLVDAGAQAIILVSNDEAALLIKEMASLPAARQVPLIAHWGLSGGKFVEQAGNALMQVDLSVLQTFSFFSAEPAMRKRFMHYASPLGSITRIDEINSPVGAAHAYDATHILARAIQFAGSTDRVRIRNALEKIQSHHGLVKNYAPPFTSGRHEALGKKELMMTRFRADGVLVPR